MKSTLRIIDPDDSLEVARVALLQTEQRISDLEKSRAVKISDGEGDYLAEVDAIDRELFSLRANVGVHQDRIVAMQGRQRDRDRARRKQERSAAIARIEKLVGQRTEAGQRLDGALKQVAEAFAELSTADAAVFEDWPDVLPPASRLGYLRALRIEPLSSMRKHRMTAGLIAELINRGPFEIASEVEKRNGELVAELRGIVDEPGEDAAA
jgi:hypothetical protein